MKLLCLLMIFSLCAQSSAQNGPAIQNVHIQMAHTKNPANGMPTFQLTCLASGVYPALRYSWSDITCDNGNAGDTCTFTPGADENSVQPTCFTERRLPGVKNKIAQYGSALFWLSRPPIANTTKTMHTAVGKSISFLVKSYPAPDNFTFIHLHNEASTDGSIVSSSRFYASCTEENAEQLMVMCFITPRDIPEQLLGNYSVVISNDLGSVTMKLLVDPGDNDKSIYVIVVAVAGGVGVALVTGVIVIVVIVCKRRDTTYDKPRRRRHRQPSHVYLDLHHGTNTASAPSQ